MLPWRFSLRGGHEDEEGIELRKGRVGFGSVGGLRAGAGGALWPVEPEGAGGAAGVSDRDCHADGSSAPCHHNVPALSPAANPDGALTPHADVHPHAAGDSDAWPYNV